MGFVVPKFNSKELEDYYQQQYWEFRDEFEGSHIVNFKNELHLKFNNNQLSLHQERINFIDKYLGDYTSVLDFGAGDCSASFLFKKNGKVVTALDYSEKTKEICKKIGVGFESDLTKLNQTDLIYSSHSLEHVENLVSTLNAFVEEPISAKYLFFETPNIQTTFIFKNLIHTPHTYMFNEKAFRQISKKLNLEVLAIEFNGSHWSYFSNHQKNCRPDIRVLLAKEK